MSGPRSRLQPLRGRRPDGGREGSRPAPPKAPPAALEVRRLTVSYGRQPALWDVDARFPQGAMSAIVGPNGAGKSTLLRAALGLISRDAGQSFIEGRPSREALDRVAYVPQREAIDWDFPINVREVVEMGRYRAAGWVRRLGRGDRELVSGAIERVGMSAYAERAIGELSGGQRQRVFIARALAQRAELMLLDEPFAGIDARTEASLIGLLGQLRDGGHGIVVVHHDIETVRSRFDWALLLNVRTVACGPVGESLTPELVRRAYGAAAPAAGHESEPEEGEQESQAWAG